MDELSLRQHQSISKDHFDALYDRDIDPWAYQTSSFEAKKRASTIEALAGRTFTRALEFGCSIGVLTVDLSAHCETLVGVDGSQAACKSARDRLSDHPHVKIVQAHFPKDIAKLHTLGQFDLIVLSEVLYFFSNDDLHMLADYVCDALLPNGLCIVVNFDGETEAGFSGAEARQIFAQLTSQRLIRTHFQTFDGYEIATFVQSSALSALS